MISGILVLIPALLAANPPTPPAPTPDAATAAIVARLARPAPDDTAYREVRFVSVLEKPLILTGELHYGGSDELGKRVDQPYRETTTISAGKVEVRRSGKPVRHFALERAPELQALLSAFSALLGGDAVTLAKYYRIAAEQDGDGFSLTLTPQLPDLARHLLQVTVDGKGTTPRCFSFRQTDGDSSVMLVGPLADAPLPEPPTPASLAALCRSGVP